MFSNSWFKKEKPLPTMIGLGGGATGLGLKTAGGAGVDNPEGHDASGGVIAHYYDPTTKALYRSHTFTAPGNFVISSLSGTYPAYIDWMIVAPGGGGAQQHSGGGGGGGFVASNLVPTTPADGYPVSLSPTPHSPTGGTYPIAIGMAGRGDNGWPGPGYGAGTGQHALAFGVMVAGGGAGGSASPTNPVGSNGGGGGGGGNGPTGGLGGEGNKYTANNPSSPGGEGSPSGQGYDGGASSGWSTGGGSGGGGGAGGAGNPGVNPNQGDGGIGRTDPLAQYYQLGPTNPQIYGGGGGGGGHGGALFQGGTGGPGGGGNGGLSPNRPGIVPGATGTDGQGGGGGGCAEGSGPVPYQGGPGGGGCVVARYQIGTAEPGAKATGGSISYYDGKYIHTFNSPGVFTTDAGFNETIEYVVIGGGGAGGYQNGGGGGAGGFATGTTPFSTPTATPMAVTIGLGGQAFWYTPPVGATNPGSKGTGNDSTVVFPTGTITAGGGGYGANEPGNGQTMPLGSGGAGGRGMPSGGTGGEGGPQGNDGGSGVPGSATQCGGGGGGAGGVGEDAQPTRAGGGGIGVQLPTTFRNPKSTVGFPGPGPSAWWVCGGGGGGTGNASGTGGGGAGPGDPPASPTVFVNYAGGGDGRDTATPDATPSPIRFQGSDEGCGRHGKVNTGGGGGGGTDAPAPTAQTRNIGGDGGPGMCLIAYPG